MTWGSSSLWVSHVPSSMYIPFKINHDAAPPTTPYVAVSSTVIGAEIAISAALIVSGNRVLPNASCSA